MSRFPTITQITSRGDGRYAAVDVDVAMANNVKEALAQVGSNPELYGISEGELLLAIGKDRDMLSPFGIMCSVQGNMCKYLGGTIGSVLVLFSLIFTVQYCAQRGIALVERLYKFIGSLFPSSLTRDTPSTASAVVEDSDAGSLSLPTFMSMIIPAPIAAMFTNFASQIDSGSGSTVHASSGGSGAGQQAYTQGGGGSSGVISEIGSLLQSGAGLINAISALTDEEFDQVVKAQYDARTK